MGQRNTSANLSLGDVRHGCGTDSSVTNAQREELWRRYMAGESIPKVGSLLEPGQAAPDEAALPYARSTWLLRFTLARRHGCLRHTSKAASIEVDRPVNYQ